MTTLPASPQPSTRAPPNRCFSYWQRRIAGHLTLALTALACSGLFWHLFSARRDLISHLSIATAYPALFLTAAALFLGPWNVLRLRANPVSFDLRRDVGIWAGIMALLHTGIGLNVHLRGRPWLYFVDQDHHVRHDLFGFGNDTGLIAALLFLLLLAISNDVSLRRVGYTKMEIAAALDVCRRGAHDSSHGCLPAYRKTGSGIRSNAVVHDSRTGLLPDQRMVDHEAEIFLTGLESSITSVERLLYG